MICIPQNENQDYLQGIAFGGKKNKQNNNSDTKELLLINNIFISDRLQDHLSISLSGTISPRIVYRMEDGVA